MTPVWAGLVETEDEVALQAYIAFKRETSPNPSYRVSSFRLLRRLHHTHSSRSTFTA
jgi:hypothetical protein